jgi:hypothetical protein
VSVCHFGSDCGGWSGVQCGFREAPLLATAALADRAGRILVTRGSGWWIGGWCCCGASLGFFLWVTTVHASLLVMLPNSGDATLRGAAAAGWAIVAGFCTLRIDAG